jgi:hypothetical protein
VVVIRAAHASPREEAVRSELLGLLRRYDLSRWTFTGEVVTETGVIPHSHRVLTLNIRSSGDDLLASYKSWIAGSIRYYRRDEWLQITSGRGPPCCGRSRRVC